MENSNTENSGANPADNLQNEDSPNILLRVICELQSKRNEIEIFMRNCAQKERSIAELEFQIEMLKREKSELQHQIDTGNEIIKKLNAEIIADNKEWLRMNLEAVTNERDAYKYELRQVQTKNISLQRCNADLMELNEKLQSDKQKFENEYQKFKTENEALEKFKETTNKSFQSIHRILQQNIKAIQYFRNHLNLKSQRIDELFYQQMRSEFCANINQIDSCKSMNYVDTETFNSIQENHEKMQNQLKVECEQRTTAQEALALSQLTVVKLMEELKHLKSFVKLDVEVKDQSSQTCPSPEKEKS